MRMNTFFQPSSFKIKVLLILVLYVIVGSVFLSSYNTARSLGPRELHIFDKVGIALAYPAAFLSIPGFSVTENVFSTEVTLNSMMTNSGCTNCDSEEFNEPIKRSTPFGVVAGIVVEILFLYVIACAVSSLRDHMKTK